MPGFQQPDDRFAHGRADDDIVAFEPLVVNDDKRLAEMLLQRPQL
jgi:hypothetical protein